MSEPSLFGWWITFGTMATLVGPCDRDEAVTAAVATFSKHRRRAVDPADVVVRPARESDLAAFEAGRDRKWVPPEPEPEPEVHPDQGALL